MQKPNAGRLMRRLRAALYFRPLAAAIAILMALPTLSWLASQSNSNASPFLASARQGAQQTCTPSATQLIQTACELPIINQWEQLQVQTFLAIHGRPASDASLIYQYGRSENLFQYPLTNVRDEVRSFLLMSLLAVANKPAANRTDMEANVYSWFQSLLYKNEVAYYTAANNEYNTFLAKPCAYQLNSDVATANGLTWDPSAWCYPGLTAIFASAPVPTLAYFLEVANDKTYALPLSTNSVTASINTVTQDGMLKIGAIASVTGGAVIAAAVGTAIALNVTTIIPYVDLPFVARGAVDLGEASYQLAWNASADYIAESGLVETASEISGAGPAVIVIVGIVTAVEGGIDESSNSKNQADLLTIPTLLSTAVATPNIDLNAFASTNAGYEKIAETFIAQTLPDLPSTATPPVLTPAEAFYTTNNLGVSSFSPMLAFNDSPSHQTFLTAAGGWFRETDDEFDDTGYIQTINYTDWLGIARFASRLNSTTFLISKQMTASSDIACPGVSSNGGLTPKPDLQNCISYVANALQIQTSGSTAKNQITVQMATPPTFASLAYAEFNPGIPASFTVALAPLGNSVPCQIVYSSVNNTLPAGITYSNGVFSGTAKASAAGIYPQTIAGVCGSAMTTQTLTIYVASNLSFTSPSTINLTAGNNLNFLVTTAPLRPSLSASRIMAMEPPPSPVWCLTIF